MNQFPPSPKYPIRIVSNFFKNSRRYSQLKVNHWYQRHRWQTMGLISGCRYLKGTQAWDILWLRFRILHYFLVTYAYMVRFCKKNFLVGPLLGEIGLFRVYSVYAERRFFCELGKKKKKFSMPQCHLTIS